jgi:hypothetical protein
MGMMGLWMVVVMMMGFRIARRGCWGLGLGLAGVYHIAKAGATCIDMYFVWLSGWMSGMHLYLLFNG